MKNAKRSPIERRVAFACVLALTALGLIAWSLVDAGPLPVIGAMTVGQLLGTLSLLFFLYAIVADLSPALLRLRVRAGRTAATVPESTTDTDPPPPAA